MHGTRLRAMFALAAVIAALALPSRASAQTYYMLESYAWTGLCMDKYR